MAIDPMGTTAHGLNTLLLVDDDDQARRLLTTALENRGFRVSQAATFQVPMKLIQSARYAFAVFDLHLPDGSGLDLVESMRHESPTTKVLILTGHGNIETAIVGAKLGIIDYLLKPADPDAIVSALVAEPGAAPKLPAAPKSAQRVRWEHIQSIYHACHENVSLTARQLNMHRRTLQRIMAKHAPR